MGNGTIYRLPSYPSTTARKSLSPTQLATVNQTISSALLQTIALPPSKRDSPAACAFVASYAKDTALQTLQSLIWQPGSTSKDDRIIQKRTLILAEKIAPVLDTRTLLDLAIVYAQTNELKIRTIFQEALKSSPVLVQSVEADLVPALTHLFNPSQGLYAIRKAAHCAVSFLRASSPELLRCFSHNQAFILALATLYDQGLGSIAQSYGGLSILRNPNPVSSIVDEWEPIWVQAKVDLIDAFHIIITALLNDITTASGRALAAESERTFGIIFALLELPSSSSTVSSTLPTPFFNRSLLTDYQEAYSLSKTLSTALRNAAEKDARLDLLESTLQSLESSPPDKLTKRRDAGTLKILIGSSGIAPGIDNRGDGSRVRSTQGLSDSTRSVKGKDKAAQPTLATPSLVASSLATTSSVLDIDIKITQVLDIFPDHAPNYVRALLERATYGGDPEKVIMALLEDSVPPPGELESEAMVAVTSGADDVARFVNERMNVFDGEMMDVSKLRIGKAKEDALSVLRDRSFIEQMKADILRRAEAISDEEEEDVFPSSEPKGVDYAFDEDEDAGASGVKVAGDGEESGDSDAAEDAERPSKALDTETILELAYIKDPRLFNRDAQMRRSKARADLKAQTNWTDEQIEGWRIMLEKNPRKDKILQKHEFAGNHHQTPVVTITSSSGGPSGGGRDGGGAGGGRVKGGAGSTGGRGGSAGGGADSTRERAWKDKNKASRANHNRKKGHDKKMARVGAGVPPS